jgi:putative tryptophan/tyrosine transport system substrate-binding protein
VQSPDDLDRAFITMAGEGNEALFQFPSTLLFSERRRVVELAQKHHLPEMYDAREFVQLGGLAAYGANINDLFRSTAAYADRILKGAKPSELPVLQPTKFEFVINLASRPCRRGHRINTRTNKRRKTHVPQRFERHSFSFGVF